MSARHPDVKPLPLPAAQVLDTVLVRGEIRVVGTIQPAELEELERAFESGDIRAEDTYRIIMSGKRVERGEDTRPKPFAMPPFNARWDNLPADPLEDIKRAMETMRPDVERQR